MVTYEATSVILGIRGPQGICFHSLEPRVQEVGHGSLLTGHFLGEQSNIFQCQAVCDVGIIQS